MKFEFTLINNGPIRLNIQPDTITFEDILFDKNNQNIPIKKYTLLCRCGRSKKQPYCDGTHVRVGFGSQKEIDKDILQEYKGKEINITFNRSICSGADYCVKKFPNIYSTGSRQNWIDPDKGSIKEVIRSIKNCPSGALSYEQNSKREFENFDKPTLHIIKRGPLNVKGDFELKGIKFSTHANEHKYALCRCGNSKNKPFCDYTHESIKEKGYTF